MQMCVVPGLLVICIKNQSRLQVSPSNGLNALEMILKNCINFILAHNIYLNGCLELDISNVYKSLGSSKYIVQVNIS